MSPLLAEGLGQLDKGAEAGPASVSRMNKGSCLVQLLNVWHLLPGTCHSDSSPGLGTSNPESSLTCWASRRQALICRPDPQSTVLEMETSTIRHTSFIWNTSFPDCCFSFSHLVCTLAPNLVYSFPSPSLNFRKEFLIPHHFALEVLCITLNN